MSLNNIEGDEQAFDAVPFITISSDESNADDTYEQ